MIEVWKVERYETSLKAYAAKRAQATLPDRELI